MKIKKTECVVYNKFITSYNKFNKPGALWPFYIIEGLIVKVSKGEGVGVRRWCAVFLFTPLFVWWWVCVSVYLWGVVGEAPLTFCLLVLGIYLFCLCVIS